MTTFTYEGYDFEARQTDAYNIVWLAGNTDICVHYPRSFTLKEVAEGLLVDYGLNF